MQRLLNNKQNRYMLHNLRRGHIAEFSLAGSLAWIARRGYTGESVGYEIFVPQSKAVFLWNTLMDAGVHYSLSAIGLDATESLRIEAGLPLYGKELAGPYHIHPIEAGFGSCIKLHKPFFIGRQHMLSSSPSRRLMRLRTEIGAVNLVQLEPSIYNDEGKIVGVTTSSASISGQYYGLGLLDEHAFEKGNMYLSSNGSPILLTEVLAIPYSAVVDA